MLKLIQNEWMKLWNQKSTWITLGLLLLIIAGFGGLNKYYEEDTSNWRASVEDQLQANQETLADEEFLANADSEIVQNIQNDITIAEYRLQEDVAPSTMGVSDFIGLGVDLITLTTLFAVIVAAGIVSNEFSTGTIKMLLTRPVSRAKILTSKLATSLLYGLFMTVVALVFAAIVGLILFSSSTGTDLEVISGVVQKVDSTSVLVEKMLLSLGDFAMSVLFAFLIGSVFRSSSLAIGLTLFFTFMGTTIVFVLSKYEFVKYIWLSHSLTQYANGANPMIEGSTLSFSLIVLAVYALVFLAISYSTFMKRDITA